AAMVTATPTACGAWPTSGALVDVSWDYRSDTSASQCSERPTLKVQV
ncbi:jg22698, partial [Pararge aegeria aegeria]